ncbi:hypothetical protein Dimus_037605, partial [Dionaea muscipula]
DEDSADGWVGRRVITRSIEAREDGDEVANERADKAIVARRHRVIVSEEPSTTRAPGGAEKGTIKGVGAKLGFLVNMVNFIEGRVNEIHQSGGVVKWGRNNCNCFNAIKEGSYGEPKNAISSTDIFNLLKVLRV